jgi:hypothetical protein
MRWYCPSCGEQELSSSAFACPACGAEMLHDRRIFEPDLPAMGATPSDEWVAVYQPRDATEADAVQEFLEARGVPTLQLPGRADWVRQLDPDEAGAIVHLAVPRGSADEARAALALIRAA